MKYTLYVVFCILLVKNPYPEKNVFDVLQYMNLLVSVQEKNIQTKNTNKEQNP